MSKYVKLAGRVSDVALGAACVWAVLYGLSPMFFTGLAVWLVGLVVSVAADEQI